MVTPRLPPTLAWLARDPLRVRRARPFYASYADIIAASDAALRHSLVETYGLELGEFVASAVEVSERSLPAAAPDFATNVERMKRRADTDGRVQAAFGAMDVAELEQKLAAADIAFARVSDTALLAKHPHLRRITIGSPTGPVSTPAPAPLRAGETRAYGPVPGLGEHTDAIRKEFAR